MITSSSEGDKQMYCVQYGSHSHRRIATYKYIYHNTSPVQVMLEVGRPSLKEHRQNAHLAMLRNSKNGSLESTSLVHHCICIEHMSNNITLSPVHHLLFTYLLYSQDFFS